MVSILWDLINKINKKTSENGRTWGVVEVNDLDGVIDVIYSSDNLSKLEEIYDKQQLYYLDVNIKYDKNRQPRILEMRTQNLNNLISKNELNVELWTNWHWYWWPLWQVNCETQSQH